MGSVGEQGRLEGRGDGDNRLDTEDGTDWFLLNVADNLGNNSLWRT